MRELALFAGAGGGILGGLLLGWRTVCAVELDAYCRRVLLARQRDGILHPFPIWDDVRTFDGRPWRGHVDVVSGGFPCQDISAAGSGDGLEGKRSQLWFDMARIVGEVRPQFAFVENSPLLVGRGLARVLADLAALGFDARWGVIGAHHTGAPHKRDRLWIVANANGRELREQSGGGAGRVGPVRLSLDSMARRGLLPTQTAGDAHGSGSRNTETSNAHPGLSLTDWVLDDGGNGRVSNTEREGLEGCGGGTQGNRKSPNLGTIAAQTSEQTGRLNPRWVEWLMGWPIGWASLEPLEMDRFREWQRQHGGF